MIIVILIIVGLIFFGLVNNPEDNNGIKNILDNFTNPSKKKNNNELMDNYYYLESNNSKYNNSKPKKSYSPVDKRWTPEPNNFTPSNQISKERWTPEPNNFTPSNQIFKEKWTPEPNNFTPSISESNNLFNRNSSQVEKQPINIIINEKQNIEDVNNPPYREIPNQNGLLPINIPTRGYTPQFNQVGVLHSKNKRNNKMMNAENKILPLYGRPIYPGSNKWQYYSTSDSLNQVKIHLKSKGKNTMDEHGCEELSDGDIVRIPAYGEPFRVNIYHLDRPRYIPYV